MMYCRDICNRFISITKTKKVIRRFNKWTFNYNGAENYKRCGYCDIQLSNVYDSCPCCGHSRLTENRYRYQRRSQGFKDKTRRY